MHESGRQRRARKANAMICKLCTASSIVRVPCPCHILWYVHVYAQTNYQTNTYLLYLYPENPPSPPPQKEIKIKSKKSSPNPPTYQKPRNQTCTVALLSSSFGATLSTCQTVLVSHCHPLKILLHLFALRPSLFPTICLSLLAINLYIQSGNHSDSHRELSHD